jgi:hypothetical protein
MREQAEQQREKGRHTERKEDASNSHFGGEKSRRIWTFGSSRVTTSSMAGAENQKKKAQAIT